MLNQHISERTYPSEAVLQSLFLISPFLRTHTRKRCPLTRLRHSTNDAFRYICKTPLFCPLGLFTIFSYQTIQYEHRLNQTDTQKLVAKRTMAFTSCHNNKIIVYTPVVHHCPVFKTEGKV